MMNDSERESLELKADVLRAKLLGRFDELERRRTEILALRDKAMKTLPLMGAVAVGAVLLLGATAGLTISFFRRRSRNDTSRRLEALAKLWKKPERFGERRSLVSEIARKLVITAVTVIAQRYLMKALRELELRAAPAPRQLTA